MVVQSQENLQITTLRLLQINWRATKESNNAYEPILPGRQNIADWH